MRWLLGLILTAAAFVAWGPAVHAQEALTKAEVQARWGILADFAGRDFSGTCPGCSEMMMLFRWSNVGEELIWTNTGSWGQGVKTVVTASAGGNLAYVSDSGPEKGRSLTIRVESDGALVFQAYGKMQSRMRKVDDGIAWDYRKSADAAWIESIRYVDIANASEKTRQVAEKRRQKFGIAAPARTSYAAAPQSPPVYAAAAAPIPKPAEPITQGPMPATPALTAASGPRLALVIGNSRYGAALGALPNPANDAALMSRSLRAVGFQVEVLTDADQKTMKRAISRFGERLRAAGRGSTGLFFYAGHGIQSRGTNYLIPVGAAIEAEADVDLEAVAADTVLLQMEEAGAATNIVVLDACRNMPLTRSFRSASRGLARMEAPNGSFVAYSTAPGSVAADGEGSNSPFVTALAQQIGRRGEPIEVVFRDVRRSVLETTGGRQTPWDSSSLIAPFYFVTN